MLNRILIGILGIPLLIYILLHGGLPLLLFVNIVILVGIYELFKMGERSGKDPDNKAPSIQDFSIGGQNPYNNITYKVGEEINASVLIIDPDGDNIQYVWQVIPESTDKKTGGDKERAPKPLKGVISKSDLMKNDITFIMNKSGQYRLFLFAKDGNGNVANGNIPFLIR